MKISVEETTQCLYKHVSPCLLVAGDLMLDRYLWGQVERISPEAPVPIVEVYKEENRLGGAANVALNLKSLGAEPILCGVIGEDLDGDILMEQMALLNLTTEGIVRLKNRRTTVKTRILGNKHQMLRVDQEVRHGLNSEERQSFLDTIQIVKSRSSALIFEDYDKGLLDEKSIQVITSLFKQEQKPVFVDPKFRNFLSYKDSTVFKPNLKELNEALGLRLSKDDFSGMLAAIRLLRAQIPHSWTFLTLSENGALMVNENMDAWHIPAHARSITDVSGAGDTVISTLAYAHLKGIDMLESAATANLAGGLVCESPGVVPVDIQGLLQELNRIHHFEMIAL